jgi:hypothetical protein
MLNIRHICFADRAAGATEQLLDCRQKRLPGLRLPSMLCASVRPLQASHGVSVSEQAMCEISQKLTPASQLQKDSAALLAHAPARIRTPAAQRHTADMFVDICAMKPCPGKQGDICGHACDTGASPAVMCLKTCAGVSPHTCACLKKFP